MKRWMKILNKDLPLRYPIARNQRLTTAFTRSPVHLVGGLASEFPVPSTTKFRNYVPHSSIFLLNNDYSSYGPKT